MTLNPGRWAEHAACRGQQHLMILPERPRTMRPSGPVIARINQGKQICARCPVRAACREWALHPTEPAVGMIAGGLTEDERRDIRTAHKIVRTPRQTYAG